MKHEGEIQLSCGPRKVLQLQDGAKQFGFASITSALDDDSFGALCVEAAQQRCLAAVAKQSQQVAYRAHTADLGQTARLFLESGLTANLLECIFNERFVLTREASCYTYYERGDFLGRHRDREGDCAVTLILYLDVQRPTEPSAQTGLELRVYPSGEDKNLPARLVIPTHVGRLVVGRGSQTWHERPALQKGECLTALTACFKQVI